MIIYWGIFVNQQTSKFKLIVLSIFVIIGLGSWLFVMFELFKNIIRRLKEKKNILRKEVDILRKKEAQFNRRIHFKQSDVAHEERFGRW